VNPTVRRVLLALAAPVAAVVVALIVSSIALLVSGNNPIDAYRAMWDYVTTADSIVSVINRAVPYYIAAVAVAIGFKMNLFNIGVDGQYRLAALVAAAAGAAVNVTPVLEITLVLAVAMLVGGAYAAIPGVLKATRGVNEVVSTIMLNFIATGMIAYLLAGPFKSGDTGFAVSTEQLPRSGWWPSLNGWLSAVGIHLPRNTVLQGFLLLAIAVGILFYVLIYRTRFGFDLRITGLNPDAARASGVNPKAMIMKTMVLSGMIAGLVGMGPLLSDLHKYGDTFPTAIGFTGIAVALLGRNSPGGIAVAAIVWAGIERASQVLNKIHVPQEIGQILQGTLLLSAVIAFEVVRRYRERLMVKDAAARTAQEHDETPLVASGATS
jgi:simple sugar transport system permease protein